MLSVPWRIGVVPRSYGVLASDAPVASHGCHLTATLILKHPFGDSLRILLSAVSAGCPVRVVALIDPFAVALEYGAIARLAHLSLLCCVGGDTHDTRDTRAEQVRRRSGGRLAVAQLRERGANIVDGPRKMQNMDVVFVSGPDNLLIEVLHGTP